MEQGVATCYLELLYEKNLSLHPHLFIYSVIYLIGANLNYKWQLESVVVPGYRGGVTSKNVAMVTFFPAL